MVRLRSAGLFALVALASLSCTADNALPLADEGYTPPETAELREDNSKQQTKSDYLRRLSDEKINDELALAARRLSDAEQAEATRANVARAMAKSEPNHRTPVRRTPEGKRTKDRAIICRCAPGDPLCGLGSPKPKNAIATAIPKEKAPDKIDTHSRHSHTDCPCHEAIRASTSPQSTPRSSH